MSDLTPDLRSMPEKVLGEAAEAMWVSSQNDREWARRVVNDVFSPPDDLPPEALDLIASVRTAYPILARWVTSRVLDEAAHQIRSGDQSRDPYEREAVGYVVDQLQQFANEAEAAVS